MQAGLDNRWTCTHGGRSTSTRARICGLSLDSAFWELSRPFRPLHTQPEAARFCQEQVLLQPTFILAASVRISKCPG